MDTKAIETERLYYEDPYLTDFQARVVQITSVAAGGSWKVVLDRSAFYPESGGQPGDHGTLELEGLGGTGAAWRVLDTEEDGAAVVHTVEPVNGSGTAGVQPLEGQTVRGRVDWGRRFDHMQQHSGQHILSAAMVVLAGANTIGFHLSDQSVTIDLDVPALDGETLEKVEREANRVIFTDLPVACGWYTPEEATRLPLRKPPGDYAKIRVVEVQGFDWSACGGTHPRRTGEIGLIKILGLEKVRGTVRVAFACGERARREFELRLQVTRAAGAALAVPVPDIPAAVEKLATANRDMAKELDKARKDLLIHEAAALWTEAAAKRGGTAPVIVSMILSDRSPGEVKALAEAVTAGRADTYALLGLAKDGQAQVFFARSKETTQTSAPEARTLVAEALPLLGGRGGGTPTFAQGGGPAADRLCAALDLAEKNVTAAYR